MTTKNYGLHTIDYGVTGWDAIMTTDMEIIDNEMYNNRELTIRLLGSTLVDGKIKDKQIIFTVPPDKIMIPHMVKIYKLSDSLSGLTSASFGGDDYAKDWLKRVTLSRLTETTHQTVIYHPAQEEGPPIVPVQKITYEAGLSFGININETSTKKATFVAALFGNLIDI